MQRTTLSGLLLAIALCTAEVQACAAGAATVTRTVGSFVALRLATSGRPHTCIATAQDNNTAWVYCELGSRGRPVYQEYRAPLAWIKTHYSQGETSSVWISGGYDSSGKPNLTDAASTTQGTTP